MAQDDLDGVVRRLADDTLKGHVVYARSLEEVKQALDGLPEQLRNVVVETFDRVVVKPTYILNLRNAAAQTSRRMLLDTISLSVQVAVVGVTAAVAVYLQFSELNSYNLLYIVGGSGAILGSISSIDMVLTGRYSRALKKEIKAVEQSLALEVDYTPDVRFRGLYPLSL